MDFTAQYAFPGVHQPYNSAFMPLTPSQSGGSDDFTTTSPPIILEKLTDFKHMQEQQYADHFAGFDYAQGFGATGPQQHQHQPQATSQQQQQQQQHHSPATSNGSVGGSMHSELLPMPKGDYTTDEMGGPRTGSDDDESLTPAQTRRKAQNRAAQRAFRERKEKHVKDLETKLASLEAAQKEAANENERLRRDLQKMSTENEILRATSTISAQNSTVPPEPLTTGPMTYKPTDFYTNVLAGHQNQVPSHRIVTADDGQRLLAAGAAWDYIINHDLYKRGLVDVSQVAEFMKHCAKCDGQGPVFSEADITFAIEQSVASGSDDLL